MRPLRYSINVTLDGCCDHRAIPADEELHRHAVENIAQADALLFGRVTYEMMEAAFRGPAPAGARPDWMEPFARQPESAASGSNRKIARRKVKEPHPPMEHLMNLDLKGRNCIVLGGSRGIGRAIALGLAAEGANVAICARTAGSLHETESALQQRGVRTYAAACDVGNAAALAAFLDAARKALGGVDVLVHNASALAVGPSLADWDASIQVDLMGAVRACEQVVPWMVEAGGGSILFISSGSGLGADPMPDYGYTAAKAALIAHAKKLAIMLAPRGVRVTAIAPGSIEFPGGIWATVKEQQPAVYESVRASIPWGRLGTPEEVANVAVFLVSPRASWVVGDTVLVDGGQHRGFR